MKIKLNDVLTVSIRWRHNNWEVKDNPKTETEGTTCILETYDNPQSEKILRTETAQALLAPTDQFCKDKGRKVSLTRVLRKYSFSVEQRRQIWDRYLSAFPRN
jgi:hypothetical protein